MIKLVQAQVAFRRIYMDISGEVDAQLEALATEARQTKKAYVESLILSAVEQSNKKGKGKK